MLVQEDPPTYDAAFFEALDAGAARSAAAVAEWVVGALTPTSVVDIGCGTGRWLAAFRERGVARVFGVDGPWVQPDQLAIPRDAFRSHDLSRPVELDERFDVALCLETAEHLPPERAEGLVRDLVRLAPVVLFSAAIPGQVGIGHINEQWPTYWRDLFAAQGYGCQTHMRERFWHHDDVEVWYRQNLLIFAEPDQMEPVHEAFRARAPTPEPPPLDIVHPLLYARERRNIETWSLWASDLQRQLADVSLDLARSKASLAAALNEMDVSTSRHAEALADLVRLQARVEHRLGIWLRTALLRVRQLAGSPPAT